MLPVFPEMITSTQGVDRRLKGLTGLPKRGGSVNSMMNSNLLA